MTGEQLLERISIDPAVAFGKPTVKGTRIAVGFVLELLAGGMATDELLEEYPQLSGDDVRACLAYGAQLANETFVDVA